MFVTSRRCFINCLAQFMDYGQIRYANYYICDVSSNSRYFGFESQPEYDDDGNLLGFKQVATESKAAIQQFQVNYSNGSLDPHVVLSKAAANGGSKHVASIADDEEASLRIFREHLMEPDTIGEVCDWFYDNINTRPKGNGLIILIIVNEQFVRLYGHTICEYLSNYFGEDIEFIDAQMRPEWIPGYPRYVGNKQFAEKLLRDYRDYALQSKFTMSNCQAGYEECKCNMITTLSIMNPTELMHLYELLFPSEPLPPGNYTTDQIKQIIIGKSLDRRQPPDRTSNMYTANIYLDAIDDEIDRMNYDNDDLPF